MNASSNFSKSSVLDGICPRVYGKYKMFAHVLLVGKNPGGSSTNSILGFLVNPSIGSHFNPVTNRNICSNVHLPSTLLPPAKDLDSVWYRSYVTKEHKQ